MGITFAVVAALLLDAWLGEVRRFHPLIGFGKIAETVEQHLYADSMLRGLTAILLLVTPLIVCAIFISLTPWYLVFDILVLYFAIGWNSLGVHARRVKNKLLANNLDEARRQVGFIVSRDTTELNHVEIAQGTIESVLENGNDALFGVIFWFVIAGAPGALFYRLINTLDAMWGYRNDRYHHFGWAAARLDDCLNFVPARLTALSYALTGRLYRAIRCWRSQGMAWKSPNAGPVMAAGAGSLNVLLGGPAMYHGKLAQRPILGAGRLPDTNDIDHALALISRSLILWIVVLFLGEWCVGFVPLV